MPEEIYEAIGGLRADVRNMARSLDEMRTDMKTQHASMLRDFKLHEDVMNGRVGLLEAEKAKKDGADAKTGMIRGIVLTVFGGAVGSAIIAWWTHH